MKVERTLVTLLVSLALVVTVALSGVSKAEGAPAHPNATAPTWHRQFFSKTVSTFLKLSQEVTSDNNSATLDYRIVEKYFWYHDHQTWGREFAAGWLSQHSIAHISSAELARVKAIKNYKNAASPALAPVPMRTCTGKHGVKKFSNDEVWQYMNSCETTDMLGQRNIDAIWIGVAAGILGIADILAGVIMGIFLAVYATKTQNIQNAQNASDTNSIIMESRDYGINETNGTRYVSWTVVPQ